jgi:hypothetical protein
MYRIGAGKVVSLLFGFIFATTAFATEVYECKTVPQKFEDITSCSTAHANTRLPIQETLNALGEGLGLLVRKIDYVIVSPDFSGTMQVEANIDWKKGQILGYRFIVSPRALALKNDLPGFLTWKESQFLGERATNLVPKFDVVIAESRFPTLYYGLLHELGHVAWYEFGVDEIGCDFPQLQILPYILAASALDGFIQENPAVRWRDLKCTYSASSFRAISWLRQLTFDNQDRVLNHRLHKQDIKELYKICFYGCENPVEWTAAEVMRLYSGLFHQTAFTSVYSAYHKPEEDFAESFAFRYLARSQRNRFHMHVLELESFDLLTKTQSRIFASKATFIDELLRRSDLKR